jgi:DNA replication and repair protein RecF
MTIDKILIKNIRNIKFFSCDFTNNFNVIVGNNAQGKSNLIECLYYIGNLKSFRSNEESDLINFNEKEAKIDANITKKDILSSIKIYLYKEKNKYVLINDKKTLKTSDYIGKFNITLFSPDDLFIIKGDSSYRRRFMDNLFSQIDKDYLGYLIDYYKILKQRNQLLKMIKINIEKEQSLDPWDEQIVKYSSLIFRKRSEKVIKINEITNNIHNKFKKDENIVVIYKDTIYCSAGEDQANYEMSFKNKLKRVRSEEISRGISLLGPHRDDLEIKINDINTRIFGSQGQKRSVAISMRMAEAEIIKNEFNEYPVLLLDDIFSELDENRKRDLLSIIEKKSQVFITGTQVSDFGALTDKADFFHIENGAITPSYAR